MLPHIVAMLQSLIYLPQIRHSDYCCDRHTSQTHRPCIYFVACALGRRLVECPASATVPSNTNAATSNSAVYNSGICRVGHTCTLFWERISNPNCALHSSSGATTTAAVLHTVNNQSRPLAVSRFSQALSQHTSHNQSVSDCSCLAQRILKGICRPLQYVVVAQSKCIPPLRYLAAALPTCIPPLEH